MKPRITLSKSKDGELEIWVNEAGRDLLMHQLGRLTAQNDHFHLGSGEGAEVPLSIRAYHADDEIIEDAKVMLRLDEWDARYFPHVLDATP